MPVKTQYLIHGEETSYRVRPNPDCPAVDGSDGIVLEYRDAGESEWKGYFFISPEAAKDVWVAMKNLIKDKP